MTKFTFRNKLKTDNGIVWGQVSAHFDLTGNPVKCRSGPAAVRGAIVKKPLERELWEGDKAR